MDPVSLPQADPLGPVRLDFELVYEGSEVDGSIVSRDLINALTGMTDVLPRIASEYDSFPRFELRVRDIAPGSVHLLFSIVEYVKANPVASGVLVAGAGVAVTAVTNTSSGFYKILTDLATFLKTKKELKGERLATTPAQFEENAVVLLLPNGEIIPLTKEQYELLLSRRVDKQLAKIVAPLSAGKVDSVELRQNGKELARVIAPERDFFDYVEVKEDKSRETDTIDGTLNSLSKNNLRGTFYTKEGVHVPYKYVGGDMNQLYQGFTARESVRVHGKIKFGSDGLPTHIEVQSIEPLQTSLELTRTPQP